MLFLVFLMVKLVEVRVKDIIWCIDVELFIIKICVFM